ncbi:uncharacterized protein LOC124497098 isoform X2 [Dermatophagoides farinae]|uniref:uncharacterized protein LOC124497098 isoform X2 n=1 Tax=Dermatophagoides farinae TaxID=6954 RepID=UPI001F110B6B|nr:uncharacterized protein LOC124497098 [Dermatophagoides farinae]
MFVFKVIQIFLIIYLITIIPMGYSLFLYAVHDFVGQPPSRIDTKPTNNGDVKSQNLKELIERGQNLSTTAHNKLFKHKDDVKMNKYQHIVVQDLDYLELMIKRAESFLPCIKNPFMAKLIEYTSDDQSMPTLTLFIQQLIDRSNNDVGYLNSHGYREYVDKISDQSLRIEKMLINIKEKMDQLDGKEFSDHVRHLLISMIDFENLILDAEKHSNINSIYR